VSRDVYAGPFSRTSIIIIIIVIVEEEKEGMCYRMMVLYVNQPIIFWYSAVFSMRRYLLATTGTYPIDRAHNNIILY